MKQQILTLLGFLLSLIITPVFSSDDEAEIGKAPNAPKIGRRIIHNTSPGVSAEKIAGLKIRSGQDSQFNRNEMKRKNKQNNVEQVLTLEEKAEQTVRKMTETFNTTILNDAEKVIPKIIIQSVSAKLINDVAIKPNDDLLTQAKKFMRLGIGMRQAEVNDSVTNMPLSQVARHNIAAICFNEAGLKFDEFLNPDKNTKLSEYSFIEKIDFMISRTQMCVWSAHNMSYVHDKNCDPIQGCLDNLKIHSMKYDYYEFVDSFVANMKPVMMIYQATNTMNINDAQTFKNYFDKMMELQSLVQEKLKQ